MSRPLYLHVQVMPLYTPPPLFPGARVALLCPSSALPAGRLAPAIDAVSALGLDPVICPSCLPQCRRGFLAASDARRAQDLQDAFADPTIHGVLCVRGGYGAHRLLPLLDWDAIARTPKVFAGYSDITALHTALGQRCGFVTYHTIMPGTEYYRPVDGFSLRCLRRALFGSLTGPLEGPPGQSLTTLVPGRAAGPLCGGNLSVLAAGLGTPWEVDVRGKILFLEDVGERAYRVDALLTQLRNAGKFDQCAGVLLGTWRGCAAEDPAPASSLPEIFADRIAPAGKPALMGLACGHALPSVALPLGAVLKLDATARTLEVMP